MNKNQLIEALADIEHQRWSDWQKWMHGLNVGEALVHPGDLVIPQETSERWERLIATPYQDLPEHSKQADRDQVMRYWPLFVEFVAEWLEQEPPDGHRPSLKTLAEEWRKDMA